MQASPAQKVFTLESEGNTAERIDLAEFYVANDLEPEEVNAIGRLQPGEEVVFGGGAAPFFILRRVS